MNTDNLIPVRYSTTTGNTRTTDYGLIANKTITDCVPSLVSKTDGTMNYNALFAMLVNEIHQLKHQIFELSCRL
jgi:hypothetical protein